MITSDIAKAMIERDYEKLEQQNTASNVALWTGTILGEVTAFFLADLITANEVIAYRERAFKIVERK